MNSPFENLNAHYGESLNAMVGRLNIILSERFNCRILYQTVSDLQSQCPRALDEIKERMARGDHSRLVMGADLVLPVREFNQMVTGFVIVLHGAELSLEHREKALGLIDCTVVDLLAKNDELHKLIGIESAFARSEFSHNILPFRTSTRAIPTDEIFELPRKSAHRKPILITGQDPQIIKRVALEIHEQMANMAFLSFRDIAPNLLDDLMGWRELGAVTIFIEDVSSLTLHQLQQIHELASFSTTPSCPQIIGSMNDAVDLSEGQDVLRLKEVFPFVFRAPAKSMTAGMLTDLVELFLYCDKPLPTPQSPLSH